MLFKKIVTHGGRFHADEVFAIALILECSGRSASEVTLIRTRKIPKEMLSDPDTIVVDVGGVFNPEAGCFDHHQDPKLPSSAMMVLNWLKPDYASYLNTVLFRHIDVVDRRGAKEKIPTVSSCIGVLNDLPAPEQEKFKTALLTAQILLRGFIGSYERGKHFFDQWPQFRRLLEGRLVEVTEKLPKTWGMVADKRIKLVLHQVGPHWRLVGNRGIQIPQSSNQISWQNGNSAIYLSREAALDHAASFLTP